MTSQLCRLFVVIRKQVPAAGLVGADDDGIALPLPCLLQTTTNYNINHCCSRWPLQNSQALTRSQPPQFLLSLRQQVAAAGLIGAEDDGVDEEGARQRCAKAAHENTRALFRIAAPSAVRPAGEAGVAGAGGLQQTVSRFRWISV